MTGHFTRSAVNFDAGARTPTAGTFTALEILSATLFFGPALAPLPHAVPAATIILLERPLIDLGSPRTRLASSRPVFAADIAIASAKLAVRVEAAVIAGALFTISVTLGGAPAPQVAIIGQVPGTQRSRHVGRHAVITRPEILSVRIDKRRCISISAPSRPSSSPRARPAGGASPRPHVLWNPRDGCKRP